MAKNDTPDVDLGKQNETFLAVVGELRKLPRESLVRVVASVLVMFDIGPDVYRRVNRDG